MLAEFGQICLIIALNLSILLSVVPLLGAQFNNPLWMRSARPLSLGVFVFTALSFWVLVQLFLADDFSVAVVANHSNSLLPEFYKVTAIWGGHEGSMLLWILILTIWLAAVALFSRHLPRPMLSRVLAVMGIVCVGFIAFSLFTSNPFERILPKIPSDGGDLNPLLQDFAMIIHPPMLYMGYVGFSVVFAFAIAALLGGRLDTAWARWSRPWTNAAWGFLTAGIVLGSWWAYYELGWGGWWFWDPVENASFMPWLVGTALIHSLAVTEKRGVFKSWTVLLAIFTFSLSLLGTFLVRSGVLTSVHSFAADPERGLFILFFLAIIVGGSLTLYAFRAPTVASKAGFEMLSREASLLINNVILLVVSLAILLGTLFPLIMDALDAGKYSVGPPVFNAVFVPFIAILIALMGTGPLLKWKRNKAVDLRSQLLAAAIAALIIGFVFPWAYVGEFNFAIVIAVALAAWLVLTLGFDLKHKLRNAKSVSAGLKRLSASYYGMLLAHIGVAITVLGVCIDSHYRDERDLRLTAGQSYQVGEYEFKFLGVKDVSGPNYQAAVGEFSVKDGEQWLPITAEKRQYFSGGNSMTEAGIDAGLFRDLYVALGESLEGGAWAVRVQVKPYVRWIWLGGLFMVIGSALTLIDKRYRQTKLAALNK